MENVTINIHAMYPFPAITLSGHPRHLRLIAHCLTSVEEGEEGDHVALCINLGHKLWVHLEQLENRDREWHEARDVFKSGMEAALHHPYGGHFTYATEWALWEHNCTRELAATYRPAWAWHMARHIYEQMGGD